MTEFARSEQADFEPTAPLLQREHGEQADLNATYDKLFIWTLTVSAGVSGLLFGYDTGVISSTLVSIGSDLSSHQLTTLDRSLITSCTSLFALIASPLAGNLADKLGRKTVILIADVLFTVGALWQAFTSRVWGMIFGRSVVGLAIGGASLVVPLYISELAPSEMRGRLVTTSILFVTGGQVIAYVFGWALSSQSAGWRWMVGLGAVPAIVQLLALIFMSESPRWLVKVNQSNRAKAVLSKVYRSKEGIDLLAVESVLKAIEQEHLAELAARTPQKHGLVSWLGSIDEFESLISVGAHRRALAIACLLQGLQQLCGFNSLMYFSALLFQQIGFSSPILTSLSIAVTNFLLTLAAFHMIDRVGRRRILLYSVPFMVLALLFCAIGFVLLGRPLVVPERASATFILSSLVLYVAAYAVGLGNVPWQQSELFPLSVRSMGSALATTVNWSSNFIVGLTFLPMMDFFSPGLTFVIYAVVCIAGWICIWRIYPETKGLGLEEVNALLKDGWGVQQSLSPRSRVDMD